MLKFKHFINSDDSSWITFIHGAGGSSTIWHKQVKVLKEHFNLLLIDLRGHGMSNDMPVDNHYSLDLVVDEVVEVIQHLNIKKSHFIGVSLGTIIITKISNLYPKIVDKPKATFLMKKVNGFIEGGADIILIETIFDTLNAKAAIVATKKVLR